MGACIPLCEVSEKSMGGISSDILEFRQNVLIMHELKTGFNADKFATFWMLPESFYCLFAGLPHQRACRALQFFCEHEQK